MTIGKQLKEKRIKLGISLADAENELKIKQKYLKKLENEGFNGFFCDAQAKGFLKNYAKFLKINKKVVESYYDRDILKKDVYSRIEAPKPAPKKKPKFKLPVIINRKSLIRVSLIALVFLFGTSAYILVNYALKEPAFSVAKPFELSNGYDGVLEYSQNEIAFEGEISDGSVLTLNGEPISLDVGNNFKTDKIPFTVDGLEIKFIAKNFLNRTSEINLTLVKPEDESSVADLDINVLEDTTIQIKIDEIIVFEGEVDKNQNLSFEANSKIEIQAEDPNSIQIFIDDEESVFGTEEIFEYILD